MAHGFRKSPDKLRSACQRRAEPGRQRPEERRGPAMSAHARSTRITAIPLVTGRLDRSSRPPCDITHDFRTSGNRRRGSCIANVLIASRELPAASDTSSGTWQITAGDDVSCHLTVESAQVQSGPIPKATRIRWHGRYQVTYQAYSKAKYDDTSASAIPGSAGAVVKSSSLAIAAHPRAHTKRPIVLKEGDQRQPTFAARRKQLGHRGRWQVRAAVARWRRRLRTRLQQREGRRQLSVPTPPRSPSEFDGAADREMLLGILKRKL